MEGIICKWAHLAVVEDQGLAEHKATPQRHGDEGVGIAGQLRGLPQAQVALVGQVEGECRQACRVLALCVQACPGWLALVQNQQDWLVVAMQEGSISHLHHVSVFRRPHLLPSRPRL